MLRQAAFGSQRAVSVRHSSSSGQGENNREQLPILKSFSHIIYDMIYTCFKIIHGISVFKKYTTIQCNVMFEFLVEFSLISLM